MKFDKNGFEIPDPKPLEIPAGMKRPESLAETIKRMMRQHELHRVASDGDETFEEANDFDMDDDDAEVHATHHELHEEVVDEVKRVKREQAAAAAERRAADEDEAAEGEISRVPGQANTPRPPSRRRRSPERRPTGRREDAASEADEETE